MLIVELRQVGPMTPDKCNPPRRRWRVQSFRHTLANQVLGTAGGFLGLPGASRGESRPSKPANLSLWVRHWVVILAQRGVCLGAFGGVQLDRGSETLRGNREGRGTIVEGSLKALTFTRQVAVANAGDNRAFCTSRTLLLATALCGSFAVGAA